MRQGEPKKVYPIRNADGELVAKHHRIDDSDGTKRRWWEKDGEASLNGIPLPDLPLYGAESVSDFDPDDLIVVTEGEPARDALKEAGIPAVGTVTGAHQTPGSGALEVLRDRRVCLWPDGDDLGRDHMERVAEGLRGVAAEVLVYTWHDAPEDVKGPDAADHPAVQSKNLKAIDRLLQDLEDSPRWMSQVSPSPNKGGTPVTGLRFSEMPAPKPREHFVEGLVPKDHTASHFGDDGTAKSILALSLATALAGNAEQWLERKVHNCPVLYIDFELDADEQHRRAYQVARGVSLKNPPHDLLYVSGLGRSAKEVLQGCLEVCRQEGVGFAIVDSLGIALGGDAESARDVIQFHEQYLDPFRAAGVTLLVIDHQGKTQVGERYQNKRSFGSVYKENLARSVIQVEPGNQSDGLLFLKLRQTKHNFGPKAGPFGARLTFTEEMITVNPHELDAAELAEEATLNAGDRVLLVLKDGPAFPPEISERSGMPLGTVKNELTKLRKRGLVEYTGEEDPHTKAKQVRLTEDGSAVTGVTPIYKDSDDVTPNEGSPLKAGVA
jgi:hypothetical protein